MGIIEQQNAAIGNAVLDINEYPQLRLTAAATESGRDVHEAGVEQTWKSALVLLPAMQWNFSSERSPSRNDFLPELQDVVDAFIDSLLDSAADSGLRTCLNVQLAYLYGNTQELESRDFAYRLLYEHRQYHYDICAGMSYGTVPFVEHQRKIRQALRDGTLELQECSAARDDEGLFREAAEARLLASLPPVLVSDSKSDEEDGSGISMDEREDS
ncbi:hypothetical protein CLAFUW4_06398 [Fulvia fulva]|uniref:Uncharacterized protein n=1 Tax=Passalora fulva TaxID=5499 RepID=A0A9Q8LIW5_PASFU|nr:uncharacterized protein CLAFUR5_06542 [Fulvia fulva]KAK4623993.1 hypothetical protein CLAFUR4_06401 [Fulvia fulva]KAK4626014.1 hypothetical protein CLAFUR0_06402 [Fulvia fulva]UJO18222.1 hypothetical protein CLAFUR5_06542 [Fulvia fulva]WPV15299.1 hypothetical protein CLAFUW4_06398 [Fulvia fulva]WPV29754.1 hypothetical protein CLAFUW7_06396 [Fulvia fulva]